MSVLMPPLSRIAVRLRLIGLLTVVIPLAALTTASAQNVIVVGAPGGGAVVVSEGPPSGNPGTAQTANPGGNPAAAAGPAGAPSISVTTIEDKQYQAKDAEFKEGKLTVKSEPPQSVAMEELQRVTLQHEFKLAAEWIGQKDRDLVQVGAAEGGNGIRDVQVRLTGLGARGIKQVAVVAKPQFRAWRLDLNQSPHWKVAIERIGQASTGEIYFEPPTRDLFETELEITITYDDNSNARSTLKATTHTSDQKDPAFPAESLVTKSNRLASVYGKGGDLFNGRLTGGTAEQFTLETTWAPKLEVPFANLRGIFFDGSKPEVKTKFDQQLAKPGVDDFVLVLSKDGGIAEITGRIQGLIDGNLKILYEGQQRSIKLERVQAIVLAEHPETKGFKGPFQIYRMASGDLFSGALVALDEKMAKLKAAWGGDVSVPREAIIEMTGRNTRMVNVSELIPSSIEQTPYFDRKMVFVKDRAWNDRPLKVDGKTYSRGLAVHSRCFLTYDLSGEYGTFRATVGFDDEAGNRGRVVCRVVADDKELFANPDFRATDKPVVVQVSVKGAKQLRLEVDFGEDEDIGDRVIWANARLFRE